MPDFTTAYLGVYDMVVDYGVAAVSLALLVIACVYVLHVIRQ